MAYLESLQVNLSVTMAMEPIRMEAGSKLAESKPAVLSFPGSSDGVKKQKAGKLSQGRQAAYFKANLRSKALCKLSPLPF